MFDNAARNNRLSPIQAACDLQQILRTRLATCLPTVRNSAASVRFDKMCPTTGKWDNDTTMKFVLLYKNNPCLWNQNCPSYKHRYLRRDAIEAISEAMNIPGFGVPEVKFKIKNLRSTYAQEKKKVLASEALGGKEKAYVPMLHWYNEFDEILKTCKTDSCRKCQNVPDNPFLMDSDLTFKTEDPLASTPNKQKRPAPENHIEGCVKVTRTEQISKVTRTEISTSAKENFELFAKSVAAQLKNMSAERALLAQAKIQTILTEYGLQDLREARPSSSSQIEREMATIKQDLAEFEEEIINDCDYNVL